jgi:hypothetical protein
VGEKIAQQTSRKANLSGGFDRVTWTIIWASGDVITCPCSYGLLGPPKDVRIREQQNIIHSLEALLKGTLTPPLTREEIKHANEELTMARRTLKNLKTDGTTIFHGKLI